MTDTPEQPQAYRIRPTKQYKKDIKALKREHADLAKLNTVINTLASGKALEKTYRDHALQGQLKGLRACHIGPDWLLLYDKQEKELLLLLLSTGAHRDVLGIE